MVGTTGVSTYGGSQGKSKKETETFANKDGYETLVWFEDTDNSNYEAWSNNLTKDEKQAIDDYIGYDYGGINSSLYNIPWEDLKEGWQKKEIVDLYHAINKFELKQTIQVNRACDSKIFGKKGMSVNEIKAFLKQSDGYVQNNAFMSFSTKSGGVVVDSKGVQLHVTVPESTGAGAFLGKHGLGNEREFLFNNNAVIKFDSDKVYQDNYGIIHVYGEWVGQAESQTISKNYDKNALSKGKKSKGKKSGK